MNSAGKISITLVLIASLVFGIWFYAGWPRIWQKPPIPLRIGVALSTTALLTGVLAFAIPKIVNPPRAYFW